MKEKMFVFKISGNDSSDAVTVIMLCAVYTFAFSLYGKSLGAVSVSQSLCQEVIKPALIAGLENKARVRHQEPPPVEAGTCNEEVTFSHRQVRTEEKAWVHGVATAAATWVSLWASVFPIMKVGLG